MPPHILEPERREDASSGQQERLGRNSRGGVLMLPLVRDSHVLPATALRANINPAMCCNDVVK